MENTGNIEKQFLSHSYLVGPGGCILVLNVTSAGMKLFINYMLWAFLFTTTLASRKDNLVSSISQKQTVEEGSSVELECS